MRFHGATVDAVVNGAVVGSFARAPNRDSGAIGIKVQQAVVNIRRVEIRQR
jgi:hypothetical protein